MSAVEITLCTSDLQSLFETHDETGDTDSFALATVVCITGRESCAWRTRELLLAR